MQVKYAFIDWLPDYRFGSDGSIWSCRKQGRKHDKGEWKLLAQYKRPYGMGYKTIGLRPKPGGKLQLLYVHRLILEAFKGPCPEGMSGCHNDGNTDNNSIENLRWDTVVNNTKDKVLHGTQTRGEEHHNSVLSQGEVELILVLRESGMRIKEIATHFNVSRGAVNGIIHNKNWKHVPRSIHEKTTLHETVH